MEDRSTCPKGMDAREKVEETVRKTCVFYKESGFKEDEGKRQHWDKKTGQRVELLDLTCGPADPSKPLLPRGGWSKLEATTQALGSAPCGQLIRENIALAFTRPLWSSAVHHKMAPPPE